MFVMAVKTSDVTTMTNITRLHHQSPWPQLSEPELLDSTFHDHPNRNKIVTLIQYHHQYGSTMTVQRPALAVLSSGPISYPLNRPVAGVYESPDPAPAEATRAGKRGRVMVVSSLKLFSDEWIDKEENSKLADVLFRWLMQEKVGLSVSVSVAVSCVRGYVFVRVLVGGRSSARLHARSRL